MYTVTLELTQGVGPEHSGSDDFVEAPTWRAEAVAWREGQLAASKDPMDANADAFVTDFSA